MIYDLVEAAIADIRKGKMVIVVDDESRENEGDLVMAAEKVTPAAINFMATEGRGLICVPMEESVADRLELESMVKVNSEFLHTNFTVSVDAKDGTKTGISASDRAKTVSMLASDKSTSADFNRPGHMFPLRAVFGGVLNRAGHTEAAVDLAKLAGFAPVGLICEISTVNGEMARANDLKLFAKKHGLKMISIGDIILYRKRNEVLIKLAAETMLPTDFGKFRCIVFENIFDNKINLALVKGELNNNNAILVRVHSECLTGESFHSLTCDCKKQLDTGLEMISKADAGVLIYLKQEGRGIGLINKIKAYKLQEQGYDTVEANVKLGFPADMRDYSAAAQILKLLGVDKIQLLTNNPLKIQDLQSYNIDVVKRVPILIEPNVINQKYYRTKKNKLGHMFGNEI